MPRFTWWRAKSRRALALLRDDSELYVNAEPARHRLRRRRSRAGAIGEYNYLLLKTTITKPKK